MKSGPGFGHWIVPAVIAGRSVFGFSVPLRPRPMVNVVTCCQNAGSAADVGTMLGMSASVRRSFFQYFIATSARVSLKLLANGGHAVYVIAARFGQDIGSASCWERGGKAG